MDDMEAFFFLLGSWILWIGISWGAFVVAGKVHAFLERRKGPQVGLHGWFLPVFELGRVFSKKESFHSKEITWSCFLLTFFILCVLPVGYPFEKKTLSAGVLLWAVSFWFYIGIWHVIFQSLEKDWSDYEGTRMVLSLSSLLLPFFLSCAVVWGELPEMTWAATSASQGALPMDWFGFKNVFLFGSSGIAFVSLLFLYRYGFSLAFQSVCLYQFSSSFYQLPLMSFWVWKLSQASFLYGLLIGWVMLFWGGGGLPEGIHVYVGSAFSVLSLLLLLIKAAFLWVILVWMARMLPDWTLEKTLFWSARVGIPLSLCFWIGQVAWKCFL